MNFQLYIPTRIVGGEHCLQKNAELLRLGKHALLVTGKNSARQGECVDISIANSKGHHVYALRVIDPAGKDVMEYRKVINVTGDAGFTIPFALNDPCGLWRAVVTDAATGVKSELKINVTKR